MKYEEVMEELVDIKGTKKHTSMYNRFRALETTEETNVFLDPIEEQLEYDKNLEEQHEYAKNLFKNDIPTRTQERNRNKSSDSGSQNPSKALSKDKWGELSIVSVEI